MQLIKDKNPFDWIQSGIEELTAKTKGTFVSHLIPPKFPAYVKIFHVIQEDLSVSDRTSTWDDIDEGDDLWALERSGVNPTVIQELQEKSTVVVGSADGPYEARRILWEELAVQYGLKFHPEINFDSFSSYFKKGSWPRYLIPPVEGSLEYESTRRLIRLLNPFTGDQGCFFYFDLLATESWESDLLYKGNFEDVLKSFTMDEVRYTPTYWWPEDHSWCVSTDYDCTFTVVGGSEELISAIIDDDYLETVKIGATVRLDYRSDTINCS